MALCRNMIATTVLPFGNRPLAGKRCPKQIGIKRDLVGTELGILAGDTIYRAIILGKCKGAIRQLLILAHIALFGEQSGERSNLFSAALPGERGGESAHQFLAPVGQYGINGSRATRFREIIDHIEGEAIIALRKMRFGARRQLIDIGRTTNIAAQANNMHHLVAFEQGKMLTDADRTDPKRIAQLLCRQLAVPTQELQNALAGTSLLFSLNAHGHRTNGLD